MSSKPARKIGSSPLIAVVLEILSQLTAVACAYVSRKMRSAHVGRRLSGSASLVRNARLRRRTARRVEDPGCSVFACCRFRHALPDNEFPSRLAIASNGAGDRRKLIASGQAADGIVGDTCSSPTAVGRWSIPWHRAAPLSTPINFEFSVRESALKLTAKYNATLQYRICGTYAYQGTEPKFWLELR